MKFENPVVRNKIQDLYTATGQSSTHIVVYTFLNVFTLLKVIILYRVSFVLFRCPIFHFPLPNMKYISSLRTPLL